MNKRTRVNTGGDGLQPKQNKIKTKKAPLMPNKNTQGERGLQSVNLVAYQVHFPSASALSMTYIFHQRHGPVAQAALQHSADVAVGRALLIQKAQQAVVQSPASRLIGDAFEREKAMPRVSMTPPVTRHIKVPVALRAFR